MQTLQVKQQRLTSGFLCLSAKWKNRESNSKISSPVKTYWECIEAQTVKISRKTGIPLYVFLRDVLQQSRLDTCTWLITMTCQEYPHRHDPKMRAERTAKLQNRLWKKSEWKQKWIGSQQISCQAGENKTGKGVAQQETERSRAQAVIIEQLEQKSLFLWWLFLHILFYAGILGEKTDSMYAFPFLCSEIHRNMGTEMMLMSFKTNKLEVTSAEMLASEVLSNMTKQADHVLSKCEHEHSPSFEYPLKLTAV